MPSLEQMTPDGPKDDENGYSMIKRALKEHTDKDWSVYFWNFVNEKVKDMDLEYLDDNDLKELIPKMGPRNRIRAWIKGLVQ